MRRLLLLLSLVGVWFGIGLAPGQIMDHVNGTAARPRSPLEVNPEAGPWMICVTSFTSTKAGDMSAEPPADPARLANELAQELRDRHRLPAYVFNRGEDERRKQHEEIEQFKQKYPGSKPKFTRIEDQFAVLIGGYKDMESARKALDHIKKLMPSDKFCLQGERVVPGKSDKGEDGVLYQQVRYSPFMQAFVARNPSLPPEKQPDAAADPMQQVDLALLRKLNAGETYSLLKNPKAWTLVVATFQGAAKYAGKAEPLSITGGLNKMLGRDTDDRSASAQIAVKLAEVLRDPKFKPGFDTYVLHTSYYSLVTIGGFDSETDPRIRQVQERLRRQILGPQVKLLEQPVPMLVPR